MTHNHNHDIKSDLTFNEKTIKILEHWINHNHEHAENYKKWANDTKGKMDDVSVLLKDASDMTLAINTKFEQAVTLIKGKEK